MYTEIQVSYGPVLFANLKDFYLIRKRDVDEKTKEYVYTYFAVGLYNGREYDLEKDVYNELKEKISKFCCGNDCNPADDTPKRGRPSKDAKK